MKIFNEQMADHILEMAGLGQGYFAFIVSEKILKLNYLIPKTVSKVKDDF